MHFRLGNTHLFEAVADVFKDRFFKELIFGILEYETDVLSDLHRILFIPAGKITIFGMYDDISRNRSEDCIHVRDQCGLSASALSNDTQHFTFSNIQIYVIYCFDIASVIGI